MIARAVPQGCSASGDAVESTLERAYAVTWVRTCQEASDALCESSHDAIIQGPGVAAELRERIFERFFRLAGSIDSGDNGSGLGLAICRSIISLHGGRIWADASPGSTGLRVVFTIPVAA
jgi:K+-sensing histidine kinase KdpD